MSDFFTTVQEPKRFRRNILESSKQIIQILKQYQKRSERHARKRKKMEELHYHFDELRELMNELDQYLPEESLHRLEELMPEEDEPERPEEETEDAGEDEVTEAADGEEESEAGRLAQALDDIESKLDEL